MSPLSKVVNIKKLANQLTNSEFDQFLSKIRKTIGKENILKLLCSQFMKSTSSDINNHESLDNMINIISNIIQSREIKENQQNGITKIDQLPSPLIGEITSYLKQKEYSLFSRSNRSIFVSCNAPNTLQQIDLSEVSNYSLIKLQNYPQITHLTFNLRQINEFQMNQSLNRLQTIIMDGDQCSNEHIQQFMNIKQNHLNLDSLRVASFVLFDMEFQDFSQLLSQFKMIKYLDLWNVDISGNINSDEIKQFFPNLNRFDYGPYNTPFCDAILNEYASNLECLSFWGSTSNYKQMNFVSLQSCLACHPYNENMNDILKTAKGLKHVIFAPYDWSGHQHMNIDQISAMIKKLIIQQKSLEFLYIPLCVKSVDIFKCVVDSVENGLYKTRNRKRKTFKIKFMLNCYDKINVTDFMIYISRIFNVLNVSNIKDFIVIWQCVECKKYNLSEMMDGINGLIDSVQSAELIKATETECIVGNKNCKINGYKDWWKEMDGWALVV